mmetsp:Transcript_117302/g.269451  ORF Transcript_117302/g.269451 Transcript_117302/m.269451 type:complete len:270 (-) Transcript_117302:1020-1829(-)
MHLVPLLLTSNPLHTEEASQRSLHCCGVTHSTGLAGVVSASNPSHMHRLPTQPWWHLFQQRSSRAGPNSVTCTARGYVPTIDPLHRRFATERYRATPPVAAPPVKKYKSTSALAFGVAAPSCTAAPRRHQYLRSSRRLNRNSDDGVSVISPYGFARVDPSPTDRSPADTSCVNTISSALPQMLSGPQSVKQWSRMPSTRETFSLHITWNSPLPAPVSGTVVRMAATVGARVSSATPTWETFTTTLDWEVMVGVGRPVATERREPAEAVK